MDDLIKKAAYDLRKAKKVVALTGAGISVESGIPPFRGKGGLWEKIDPMKYAHINYFLKHPEEVWNVLIKEMKNVIDRAKPNDAHKGLAAIEKFGISVTIITQNVDGLHQIAGSTDVIEFHGNFAWHHCMDCGKKCETGNLDISKIPPQCECGGIYRPDCVFFGEMIPHDALWRSRDVSAECDMMLVVGTSAVVEPAAYMPVIAKKNRAKVVEINPEETQLSHSVSDYLIKGKAGKVMNSIIAEMENMK